MISIPRYQRLNLYLLLCFICVSSWSYATPLETMPEPMGTPEAPLGTVWVQEIEPSLKQIHTQMMRHELGKTRESNSINTNIAMFRLSFRLKDQRLIPILDRSHKTFLSGGFMLVNPESEELHNVSSLREQLASDVTTKKEIVKNARSDLTKFAGVVGSAQTPVDTATADFTSRLQKIRQAEANELAAKKKAEDLEVEEKKYAPAIFSDKKYHDHTNATYDPEQTIARIINHHMDSAILTDKSIKINGVESELEHIDSLILNLHSRTDMCPFCSMYLADRIKAWNRKLQVSGIPVVVIVSSRQEYRCAFPFITQQPYYNGFSMRSFSWRSSDDATSIDGIKKISKDGLIIQYAFPAWEVYLK